MRIHMVRKETQHSRIDHVHCLRVHLFLHTALLFLQVPRAVLELSNIDLAEIILRSRLAEQATTYALSKTVGTS